jgi:hypothetical protein
VLDDQLEAVVREAPALDLLVGLVAAPVDPVEDRVEVFHGRKCSASLGKGQGGKGSKGAREQWRIR